MIRFDKAQEAVLTVVPLSGNIIFARGIKAPCERRRSLNSSLSPATFPNAHAHCSATHNELLSTNYIKIKKN